MKKTLLSLALLISSVAFADIKLDIKGNCGGDTCEETIILKDGENTFSMEHKGTCKIAAQVTPADDEVTIEMNVIKTDENGNDNVVCQPVIKAEWGKEAVLELCNKSCESEGSCEAEGREVSISVTATQVEADQATEVVETEATEEAAE